MRASLFAVVMMMFCLAACTQRNPLLVQVERCPAVAVVGDTGTLTEFAGDGRTSEDIAYQISISDVRNACAESSRVITDLEVDFTFVAGPAYDGAPVELSYFVTVMRDNLVFVSKKTYSLTLSAGNPLQTEQIRTVIPDVDQIRRYDYEVLVGMQVTPEQAVYNMQR